MKQQRAVAFACANNAVQGLAPASPVMLLAFSPGLNQRPQGLKFLAEMFSMGTDFASRGVAPSASLVPRGRIVAFGLVLLFGFQQGLIQGLLFGDQFRDFIRVYACDQAAPLEHRLTKGLA